MIQLIDKSKPIDSISPPETAFLFTVWGHMVPPYRPDHTLILGYGGGTVAELMRKVWGQCKITGVDLEMPRFVNYQEYKLMECDAVEFVDDCTKDLIKTRFDYILVDLWENGKVCQFIYSPEFVNRLKEMTKRFICVNIPVEDLGKMRAYNDAGFQFLRHVNVEGNIITWWSNEE